MPAPWRTRGRSPIAEPIAVVPDEIAWKTRPGEQEAHAFSSGAGWMRSVCRAERWTVSLVDAPEDAYRCDDCWLLTDGAPGEITEAYGS